MKMSPELFPEVGPCARQSHRRAARGALGLVRQQRRSSGYDDDDGTRIFAIWPARARDRR